QGPHEQENETGEDHLQPDGDAPGERAALQLRGSVGDEGSGNTAHEPHAVVNAGHDTTVRGVGNLRGVRRTGRGTDRNAETEQEAATHELSQILRSGLNASTNDNDSGANGHANTATCGNTSVQLHGAGDRRSLTLEISGGTS